MRHRRTWLVALLLAFGLTASGCATFDPTEWFTTKKPLPGERRPVFPQGVPGVPQGVPPELVEGYQPAPEPVPEPRVVEEKPKPKPRPRPAPKPVEAAAPRSTATGSPPQAPQAPQAQQAPWPEAPPTPARPAPAQSGTVFPDPPRR